MIVRGDFIHSIKSQSFGLQSKMLSLVLSFRHMSQDNESQFVLFIFIALELRGEPEHLLGLVVEPPLQVGHLGGCLVVLDLYLIKLLPLDLERVLQGVLQTLHTLLVPLCNLNLERVH